MEDARLRSSIRIYLMKEEYTTHSDAETRKLGATLAGQSTTRRVIALTGKLGAGKTVFMKGIAQGFGITKIVQSPTFVLMKTYPIEKGKFRILVHVDCYRIEHERDMRDIGLHDYIGDTSAIVVIEWADRIPMLIPNDAMMISFEIFDRDTRRITITTKD